MSFTPKRLGSVAYSLVMFVLVSVLAGVLVAGLFVPFAGMAGVSGRAAAAELDNLPAELRTPTPPVRSTVKMADGKVLARFFAENRVVVKLDRIAPVMRQAQLAIEDHRFYEHGALDFKGTLRALIRNSTSDNVQGGSSITQQYVKMVQIVECQKKSNPENCVKDAQAPTLDRKIRELRYAIAVEKKFSKDEILERYLNIAYYGNGAYGVEAAGLFYFGVRAKDLSLAQAAMLAGIVQNPYSINPVKNTPAALDRRDVVLNRMAEVGLVTTDQARKAKKVRFDKERVKRTRNGCLGAKFPFLCDYVFRSLLNTPSLGKTRDEREDLIMRGGLTIETKIDPKSQELAEENVANVVGPKDPLISTMNMIQPGTGLIVAMAQSRPVKGYDVKEGETDWNLSVEPEMGGIQGYQAGSTFKLFTLAAALEKGIPINKKFNARSPMEFGGKPYTNCRGSSKVYGKYRVKNSVGHSTTIDMTEAAEWSVNTYFIQLELATGLCRVTKMAEKMGVKVGHQIGEPPVDLVETYQDIASFTLGTVEVSPLSMAEAYATVAARGIHCDPVIVSEITTRTGKKLQPLDANCKRVMDQKVADGVNKILKSVVDKGTGSRAKVFGQGDMAGKTGTINSAEAVWFAGYTPEIAGVAMISIDNTRVPFSKAERRKGKQYKSSGVTRYTVPSSGIELEGSGSGDSGKLIWKPVMEEYLKRVPNTSFKAPPREVEIGKQVPVPYVGNLGVFEAQRRLEQAGFSVVTDYVFSDKPVNEFIGWSPGPGQTIAEFGTISLLRSKGPDPAIAAEKRRLEREAEEREQQAEEARKKKEEDEKKKKEEEPEDPPGSDPKPR